MKRKLILLRRGILLFLIANAHFAAQAQKSNTILKPHSIFFGLNFSPDYSFRTLRNKTGTASSDLVINSRNEYEIAKTGYTMGLNLLFHCSERFGLETGLQYSDKGYKTKKQKLTFELPGVTLPTTSKSTYSYRYIGIPLKARFTWGSSNVRFISSVGFITNYLLEAKQTHVSEYVDGRSETRQSVTSQFEKIDVSPMLSLGIAYKLNENLQIILEPTFRYGITKTMDAPVAEHLWSVGLNVGFYHRLK